MDLQRNGKASVAVGRWPSLLSLTCPRSSGSDLSLSSGCSEYSSGSHTWAEGRGLSKQCGGGRDKRMSSGSFSSNHSAPIEPTEIGWKEGHILKGLKRLQMCPKEASLLPSAPQCKDCMTSNEGIYSFGINERLQSLKLQREQARRLQIEQQFSSAFGEPVSEEEPERQSTITTIEEKVMIGIEENLHKSQEQDRTTEVKPKSGSSLANWFGFRKSKLPAPSKKTDAPKVKEEKREQKITSLLGGKQTKAEKKRERRKSEGKEISDTRREPHDAVRSCISMPCPGMSLTDLQGHADAAGDAKVNGQRNVLVKARRIWELIGSNF
uniref:Nck-associated protein 5 C-terminal domain-containing protein n=1 Tax=Knipowitschia caucasica TaxID=637954 RepID=A0AAV2K5E3_KNICA